MGRSSLNCSLIVRPRILLIFFACLLFCGCPFEPAGDSTLTIVNNSEKKLHFYFDTSSSVGQASLRDYPLLVIEPHSSHEIYEWWHKIFEDTDIERLFLFDDSIVMNVEWDTIRAHSMYLTRIDFTLRMLDSLGWRLTYPQ
jgi:hypothetical protein